MIKINSENPIKKQIDCPYCYSLLEWDSGEDLTTVNGNQYIICPECGQMIQLNPKQNYISMNNDSDGGNSLKYIKDDPSNNGGVIEGLVEGEAGQINVASGINAHAEGGTSIEDEDEGVPYYLINTASGQSSHAEGSGTTASGYVSHAEGTNTIASGSVSHAEGDNTTASGYASHAEGYGTTASGPKAHAEGANTIASEALSHAEGANTTASGSVSHAEGANTIASGEGSHAEGYTTTASGKNSHAEGQNTIANHRSQHVIGEFNIADPSTASGLSKGNYAFIIGNGTSENARSNALAIKWDGTFVFANGTEISPAQFQSLLALLDTSVESGQG